MQFFSPSLSSHAHTSVAEAAELRAKVEQLHAEVQELKEDVQSEKQCKRELAKELRGSQTLLRTLIGKYDAAIMAAV